MINRELYFRDPTTIELLNNGVSKVSEIGHDERQIKTLRFELETFVCDGEYARGLERILKAYLDGLGREEQKAVWVSGFFGSGKSHLVKVLRYLWEDYRFDDGATARSLVKLPAEISDLLKELSNRSKPLGGLRAAAGTLGAGSMDNVRLAFIQLVLRAADLPENLAQAKFILWLRSSGLAAKVDDVLKRQKRELSREVLSLKLSLPLAEALVSADPKYANAANAQAAIRAEFPDITSPTMAQALDFLQQVFGENGKLPCTLLVVDEIQQFIGEKIQRAMDMQEIAEHCCTKLNQRLLLVGTGQSALNTTPSLQRLQARFAVRVQLSDADVESVIRKTVLRKKPEKESVIFEVPERQSGRSGPPSPEHPVRCQPRRRQVFCGRLSAATHPSAILGESAAQYRPFRHQSPVALPIADRLRGDAKNRICVSGHGGTCGLHLRPDFHRPHQLRRAGARIRRDHSQAARRHQRRRAPFQPVRLDLPHRKTAPHSGC